MIIDLLKHSLRSFKRQRAYIVINILGLAIGIACSLLITLYVINEAGYDRFNEKKDRLYRVILNGKIGSQTITGAFTPAVMGPTLPREFPEVEDFLRMNGMGPTTVEYEQQIFTDNDIIEADSSFFNFFTIPVIKGDPKNLLNSPHKVVLSETTARKIFGNEDPVDKLLKIGSDSIRYVVSGIMKDVPSNSHFDASMVTSFMTNPRSKDDIWLNNSFGLYLLMKKNSNPATVDARFNELIVKYVGPEVQKFMGTTIEEFLKRGNIYRFYLQKLTDIHLDNTVQGDFKAPVDPKYLIIFGSVAILIVLIAAINFMNLATAQASRRAKEVGIKKIGGSTRGMLIAQFLTESFILAFVSLIFALLIVKLSLPYFNNLLGTKLSLNLFSAWYTIPGLILFALLVGVMSGSYPAFFLSSFNPYEVLKGSARNNSGNGKLRRILVVFQFAVSILLIVGTLIMNKQIKYMLNKDVGFNREQLVVIERAHVIGNRMKSFKERVKSIPGVINIASSTALPGRTNNNNGYMIEGRKDETFLMTTSWVDYDFLDTYEMKLDSGRVFSESYTTDRQACILNESAMKNFGITDMEKTRIMRPGENGLEYLSIIGAVRNFNFESLRNPVQPYILLLQGENNYWGYITVRLSPANYASTISAIEKIWKEYTSNTPLQYYFLDADFQKMYSEEQQNAKMAMIFSLLAIFIAALGLSGLTSYTVEQKTREIGVRKAMGSSVAGIYFQISKEIIVLVSVSSLISWPLIYYYAGKWLENFYYKINPGFFSFVAGLLIALGIALLTISYRVIKAASVNPAQSLKYE
ncbi:MAG TPA: ABC transporter permease [Bacteroidales bacterium]|nr:ABC transporter permease [Bacteroidales bacterium]